MSSKNNQNSAMGDVRKRLGIYVRVSTQEQAQKGMSIDEQLDTLRRFAEYRGFEIVGEYVDRGFSGGSDKRPQFMTLMSLSLV